MSQVVKTVCRNADSSLKGTACVKSILLLELCKTNVICEVSNFPLLVTGSTKAGVNYCTAIFLSLAIFSTYLDSCA